LEGEKAVKQAAIEQLEIKREVRSTLLQIPAQMLPM
jgi:hypothetical protein